MALICIFLIVTVLPKMKLRPRPVSWSLGCPFLGGALLEPLAQFTTEWSLFTRNDVFGSLEALNVTVEPADLLL